MKNKLNNKFLTIIAATMLVGAAGCSEDSAEPEQLFVEQSESQTQEASLQEEETKEAAQEEESEEPVPSSEESSTVRNSCSLDSLHSDGANVWAGTILACDGDYMVAGAPNSDQKALFEFDGDSWTEVPTDRKLSSGAFYSCYGKEELDSLSISAHVRQKVLECDSPASDSSPQSSSSDSKYVTTAKAGERYQSASRPACDGRNILIINSVHIPGNSKQTLESEIGKAMAHDADLEFTLPGQCSSLRASVDGQDVYPIYYDFGFDEQAMCDAKAVHGGNARTLNNSADFSDPC